MGAKTDRGKPLFKASEGGDVDVLVESEEVTQGEVLLASGEHVLIVLKVRPCRRFTRRDDAQPVRSLFDRLTHVRLSGLFAMLRFTDD